VTAYTDEPEDPYRIYTRRDMLPPHIIHVEHDQYGVPEMLRYSINRIITQAHIDMHHRARRILAFAIDFDARQRELPGVELIIRALTEPAFKDEP
jgi:hypothetical protein